MNKFAIVVSVPKPLTKIKSLFLLLLYIFTIVFNHLKIIGEFLLILITFISELIETHQSFLGG